MKKAEYQSPLGPLYFWFEDHHLLYASFCPEEARKWLKRHFPAREAEPEALPQAYQRDLDNYFRGHSVVWEWPLTLVGTPFQKRVWREIAKIPCGQISTYKRIATALGTKAYQAVGQAVGANPISIIIPCHRVLGTKWLGGYGGGLNRKRLLLELENVTLTEHC